MLGLIRTVFDAGGTIKPFDLPPDNPFDWLHADLCRPAEVRKAYLSKPADDEPRERDDRIKQPPPAPDFPSGHQLTDGPWLRRWHEERDRETFFAAIGESLRRLRSGLAAIAS
jgi:hypothetical protein